MNYLTLFKVKTLFIRLWPLLDLRAELDFRMTKLLTLNVFISGSTCGPGDVVGNPWSISYNKDGYLDIQSQLYVDA